MAIIATHACIHSENRTGVFQMAGIIALILVPKALLSGYVTTKR